MKKNSLFVLIILCCFSCSQKQKTRFGEEVVSRLEYGIKGFVMKKNSTVIEKADTLYIPGNINKGSIEMIRFSSFIDSISYIKLESNKNSLLGGIDKLVIEGNSIFIMDRRHAKAVFVFSLNGKLKAKIGKIGKGPGEYTNLQNFFLNSKSKTITLFANNIDMITYDLRGNFIKSHKINFFAGQGCKIKDSVYAFDFHYRKPPFNLIVVDYEKKVYFPYFSFSPEERSIHGLPANAFQNIGQSFYYHPEFLNSIYKIDANFVQHKYYFMSLGAEKQPQLANFYITSKYLFCNFSYDGLLFPAIVNKAKNEVKMAFFVDDIKMIPFIGRLAGSNESTIIFHIEPINLIQNCRQNNFDIENILGDIKAEDNPILCIAKIKS